MKPLVLSLLFLCAFVAACDGPELVCTGAACGSGGGGGSGAGGGTGGGGADDGGTTRCDGPPGLYVEGSCSELAPGVRFFQPQFRLWTDGADKQRYIYLPPGARIDTSNPDDWIFPVGTRLYKTFLRDGKRIETRVLEKVSDGAGFTNWTYVAYAWNEAQDAVTAVPDGVIDALGTTHDIPSSNDCLTCHAGAAADMGLGFSAIQLNHDLVGLSLESLAADDRLTTDIPIESAYVPGDATARTALGYLHANCGLCHGGSNPTGSGLKLRLLVGTMGVEATDAYLTAVGVPSTWTAEGITARIAPGDPSASAVHARMSRRGFDQMPPLGTEDPHAEGLAEVSAWIMALGDRG